MDLKKIKKNKILLIVFIFVIASSTTFIAFTKKNIKEKEISFVNQINASSTNVDKFSQDISTSSVTTEKQPLKISTVHSVRAYKPVDSATVRVTTVDKKITLWETKTDRNGVFMIDTESLDSSLSKNNLSVKVLVISVTGGFTSNYYGERVENKGTISSVSPLNDFYASEGITVSPETTATAELLLNSDDLSLERLEYLQGPPIKVDSYYTDAILNNNIKAQERSLLYYFFDGLPIRLEKRLIDDRVQIKLVGLYQNDSIFYRIKKTNGKLDDFRKYSASEIITLNPGEMLHYKECKTEASQTASVGDCFTTQAFGWKVHNPLYD